ncbi:uncharacterized protein FOMMEDRAFT_165313 [Fomitiporia mediterranea MF3/22]|uniref:uncharacterized protein n=1 Tax=Fomitiporia mediterranea (strain MF3/22) TaxID=694068 RepID=UPI0004409C36|nr:uncharacterized protein FOMMEDRAFT_165313 [Fomitiporia mediterranea MF3/22]EJD06540.1 hypothetical protein FOMMEDRAFT_165313 [Fomitiporia mediterranea MF3/22]
MSSKPPPKRPSGGRPNVRKLISKESLSSLASFTSHGRETSQSEVREDSGNHAKARQATLPPLTEAQAVKEPKAPWVSDELASSPAPTKEDHDPFEDYAVSMNMQSVKLRPSRTATASESLPSIPPTEKSTASQELGEPRSSSSSPPPAPVSPSKIRWEQLRQHVLPAASSPAPSFTSFSQLNLSAHVPGTSRPSTPRPSRFAARFGFRQVVNEAREVADDLTRRFADDIQRACWAVHFGDSKPSKPEREATQPSSLGSTLHLPFMSSTSLPLSTNMSSNNLSAPSSFKHGLRGMTSMANLTVHAGSRTGALTNLQAIITRYASLSMQERMIYGTLPFEKEILSVLLIAFLGQSSSQNVDDERQVSMEIFETVARRWRAPNLEAMVDRCLWCCKAAAAHPSNTRTHILHLLNGILTSEDNLLASPLALRTVMSNLALLVLLCRNPSQPTSMPSVENANDLSFLHELIRLIFSGGCGGLDLDELERKYQALALKSDSEEDLRQGLCIEAMAACLEVGIADERKESLGIIEKFWPLPDPLKASTPLRSKVHLGKTIAFLRPVLNMLRDSLGASESSRLDELDYKIITQLLIRRILPEMESLTSSDELVAETRDLVVKVTLALLGSDVDEEGADETFTDLRHSELKGIVLDWLHGKVTPWREALQRELKNLALSIEWRIVVPMITRLVSIIPESSRKVVIGLMVPQLQERMVDDPPSSSYEPLSRLLASLAAMHPQIFYKPLFVCAASTKEETISRQLAVLITLAQFMPNFWTTDPEMVSVALMSDPGSGAVPGKGKAKEGRPPTWGKARLGQSVVLLELIGKLRIIREDHSKIQDAGMVSGVPIAKVLKFVSTLESRLSILIDAKEENLLLPLSQRILFCTLFLEIRLLTRSLKSAAWLPRIITWAMQYSDDPELRPAALPVPNEDLRDEIDEIWERLEVIYSLTKTSMRPASQWRNTSVVSPHGDNSFSDGSSDSRQNLVDARLSLLRLLPRNSLFSLLELLVAMSGALKHEDFSRLGPLVWDKCLQLGESKAVIHACFICMQCAEKAQDKFLNLLLARLQSPSAATRRTTVQRLSILSSWRFQLLSVTYITDRNYRRPFKLARPALNFVATDVGDSKYIPDDDLEEFTTGKGQVLPLDIRRRLHEIGWDDEEKPVDQQLEWRRTPMSLLGGTQLDQISSSDTVNDDSRFSDQALSPSPATSSGNSPSPSPRGDGKLLRRNSSSQSFHAGKRRSVFVQSLVAIFVPLAKLALDSDFTIASVARGLLIDYMRDDPAVVCRPVMEILSGNVDTIDNAMTTLRSFLHLSRVLPPRLTHHVFNHLAGFLKFLAKDPSVPDSLRNFACSVPVLAKFAPQVSEMSVRAIRRGKIEVFLFPSGSLYFPDSVPSGPMFPRGLHDGANPFDSFPKSLVHLTMIRMSQNLLFVDLLKRSPQDVHVVRKSWMPLALPDIDGFVDTSDVIPRRLSKKFLHENSRTSIRLSLSFSRTHLLFVAQVFRCLTRHLNSRDELALFLDGVNRILLRHGDDIGIVTHALIVYMIASTRFRRLMSSGTGFTLFLPALIKVYCEAEGDSGVREAIQYAVHRFFAVHEDVFVYQALQVVSNLVTESSADGAWISSNMYRLLSTLKSSSTSLYDAAGIRDSNKTQEEETALAITADERPQMFLASLRKESKTGAEKLQSSLSVEIFDSKRFHPDNIVKMLLTVIAHDPTVKRAQCFVRLFRHLVPDLYEASSSARNVLKEAVEALGAIVSSKANKTKGADNVFPKPRVTDAADETSKEKIIASAKAVGNPFSPCDMQVMRSDYLFIFSSYVQCGGAHRDVGLHRALDIAKTILKETSAPPESVDSVRLFLERIGDSFGKRQDIKYAITLLKEFAPIIRAHGSILDLSGLFKGLTKLCSAPTFANDKKFANVVVTQICSAALEVCELAAQENVLSTLKFVPALITLLARSVCLIGSDVVTELERRDPSPAFLSGVVMPFILQLYTTAELATQTQWTDSWRQDAHARAWVRLLSFAMNAVQGQQGGTTSSSRGSIRRSPSFTSDVPDPNVEGDQGRGSLRRARRRPSAQSGIVVSVRFALAFVTLKTVVLRGEEDISTVFPGAWLRVASLLRSTLRDGNATFALRTQLPSAPPSPSVSPATSTTFTDIIDKTSERRHKRSSSSTSDAYLTAPSGPSQPSSPTVPKRRNSSQHFPRPRFVDYLAWSLLEFLCLRRSPLSMQMRTYMHERVVSLNETLQNEDPLTSYAGFGGSGRRKSLRPLSTMFTKPRFRPRSTATTPEASPRLRPTEASIPTTGTLTSLHSIQGTTRADYGTPSPRRLKGGSPIKHLGISTPPANAFLSPSFVPVSTSAESHLSQSSSAENVGQTDIVLDARQALAMTTLGSPGLVKRTYERIRVVQRCLGYSTFLPIPDALMKHVDVVPNNLNLPYSIADTLGQMSSRASQLTGCITDAEEPDVHTWTRRTAAMLLVAEAQELLRAWQIELAITTSASDLGHGVGTVNAATSVEDEFNALNTPIVPTWQ